MEVHRTAVDQPSDDGPSHSPFHTLIGGFIAILTLSLPIYITARYSNAAPMTSTSASPPVLVERP